MLGFFILHAHADISGKVRDAHRRVCGIDALPPCPPARNTSIFKSLGLIETSTSSTSGMIATCDSGSVDTPLRFCFRDSLDSMRACFKFEPWIHALTLNQSDDFFIAPYAVFARTHYLYFPFFQIRITAIRLKQIPYKNARFIAPRAALNSK